MVFFFWFLGTYGPWLPVWAGDPASRGQTVPLLSDAEAWKRLPRAEKGTGTPLPAWARVLAETLPCTTAAMLELDYEHRTGDNLPAKLRARMRLIVARANRSAFGEACAVADFLRAGGSAATLRAPAAEEAERAALSFAQKLTLAAHSITDAEVAKLVEWYGDKRVVAMVLFVAYANFLDRLVLTLNLPDGAPAPLEVRFSGRPLGADRKAPPRQEPPRTAKAPGANPAADPEWLALDYDRLQKEMALQGSRRPRLRLPTEQSTPTYWGLVGRTYQPRLADAWTACEQAFAVEADQDRVFAASLFWVVTRTQRSFY